MAAEISPDEGLTDVDRAVLDLEGRFYRRTGAKIVAIAALGLSETRYYMLVNRLLDDAAAVAYAPVTVNRLRRVREARRAQSQ